MRMAAAKLLVFSKTAPGFGPIISGEMFMVRARLHQAVEVRIEIFAEHPLVVRSGDQVPEMTDNVVREKRLSVFIPVESPWIRGAIRDYFKDVTGWMVSPDGAVQFDALTVGSSRTANERRCRDTVASVEPAIRPPCQTVHEVVTGLEGKAVQMNDRRTVRAIVAIGIRNKEEFRWR